MNALSSLAYLLTNHEHYRPSKAMVALFDQTVRNQLEDCFSGRDYGPIWGRLYDESPDLPVHIKEQFRKLSADQKREWVKLSLTARGRS